MLSLSALAAKPPKLRMRGGHRINWRTPGVCPDAWRQLTLNETGMSGIESFAAFTEHIRSRVPPAADAERLCIITSQGFRLHLHHVHAWEAQGHAPRGTYATVTTALRRALRRPANGGPTPAASAAGASSSSSSFATRRGTIAIHVRRGDRVGRGATSKYPISLVRSFVTLSSKALLQTGRFPLGVDVTIYTEPANSSELFEHGCPEPPPAPSGRLLSSSSSSLYSCRVTTGALLHDLLGLVDADVLGLSSSSFSVLAYYLRPESKPALVPVKSVAQFFAASDGSDGRSGQNGARLRAERPPPPSNLFFVQQMLVAGGDDAKGLEALAVGLCVGR